MKNHIFILSAALLLGVSLAACGGADMPVTVSSRKALLGKGMVAVIENKSAKSIRITVEALGKEKTTVLDGGGKLELGHVEGFELSDNDVVTISADGYKTIRTKF